MKTPWCLVALVLAGCANPATPVSPTAAGSPRLDRPWPNEPAGLRVVSDWGFDSMAQLTGDVAIPGSGGWRVVAAGATGSARGWLQGGSDPGGPMSPPLQYDFVYPEGMVEGDAPATVYFGNLSTSAMYAAFWWKTSVPFDRGPNGNKVAFMFNGGGGAGGQLFMTLHPDGRLHVLPESPGDFRWRAPVSGAVTVTPGVWHLVEWFTDLSDGTMQWWLDGVLHGSHRDASSPQPFDMFQFSPTWGGNSGARKRQTDHYWFDHVRLSVR